MSPFATTGPHKRYDPYGRCIYCGSTEGLTDEHIIPVALGGTFVIPSASCLACADETKKFEQTCTRAMLGPLRIRMALKTRRKKERPKTLSLLLVHPDGSSETVSLDAATQYPAVCIGFKLKSPGIMLGADPTDIFDGEMLLKYPNELEAFLKPNVAVKVGSMNLRAFALMLAKIGHAHAVAEMARMGKTFDPLLPDLIIRKAPHLPYYIGGDGDPLDPAPHLHQLRLRYIEINGRRLLFTSIRLFAMFGMPRYHVVVAQE